MESKVSVSVMKRPALGANGRWRCDEYAKFGARFARAFRLWLQDARALKLSNTVTDSPILKP
jgi:hypothetical protein